MNPKQIFFLRVSGALGALAVITGAFGAHGLESRLDAAMLEVWETAVRYHFYHVMPVLALALAPASVWAKRWATVASWTFLIGIAIFSGTLYLLALTGIKWLGAITPIGGVALILGWVFTALCAAPDRP